MFVVFSFSIIILSLLSSVFRPSPFHLSSTITTISPNSHSSLCCCNSLQPSVQFRTSTVSIFTMSKDVDDYAAVKNKLTQLILKKQALESSLAQLEDSIYEKESDYFNESVHGNIVKGFENFTKSSSSSNKKKMVYTDDDHIFSLSSATFVKTLMRNMGTNSKDDYDDYEDCVEPPNHNQNNSPPASVSLTPGRKRKSRTFDD